MWHFERVTRHHILIKSKLKYQFGKICQIPNLMLANKKFKNQIEKKKPNATSRKKKKIQRIYLNSIVSSQASFKMFA